MLAIAIAAAFTGCRVRKADFDVTGYIRAVLDCSYLSDSDDYITFTDATEEEASDFMKTTFNNAAVRFFTKYEMNASDEQITKMESVLKKAFANSKFTVQDKTGNSSGYHVVVDYDIQTTFSDITDSIKALQLAASSNSADVGAAYIDKAIELCDSAVSSPTYNGTSSVDFEIRVDSEDNLSLNVNIFDVIDEEILPF